MIDCVKIRLDQSFNKDYVRQYGFIFLGGKKSKQGGAAGIIAFLA